MQPHAYSRQKVQCCVDSSYVLLASAQYSCLKDSEHPLGVPGQPCMLMNTTGWGMTQSRELDMKHHPHYSQQQTTLQKLCSSTQ